MSQNQHVVIRAFEAWSKSPDTLQKNAHLFDARPGEIKLDKVVYMVACEANTKGVAIEGSPFVCYKTTDHRHIVRWLKRVVKLSAEIEAGDRAESKANLTIPRHGVDHSGVTASPMTFAVEAAAIKFMRRQLHTDMGGQESWHPIYQGLFTLEQLRGRETVSPFNKDLSEVEEEAPEAFTETDDDFRQRRMKRRRLKKRAEALQATLDDGEALVKAYHPARSTLIAGVDVRGYRVNSIGELLTPDGVLVSSLNLPKPTGLLSSPGPNALATQTFEGYAVADSNMFTTVKTEKEATNFRVMWRLHPEEDCDDVAWEERLEISKHEIIGTSDNK